MLRLPDSRLVCGLFAYEVLVKRVGLYIQRAEVEVGLIPLADLLDVSCNVTKVAQFVHRGRPFPQSLEPPSPRLLVVHDQRIRTHVVGVCTLGRLASLYGSVAEYDIDGNILRVNNGNNLAAPGEVQVANWAGTW